MLLRDTFRIDTQPLVRPTSPLRGGLLLLFTVVLVLLAPHTIGGEPANAPTRSGRQSASLSLHRPSARSHVRRRGTFHASLLRDGSSRRVCIRRRSLAPPRDSRARNTSTACLETSPASDPARLVGGRCTTFHLDGSIHNRNANVRPTAKSETKPANGASVRMRRFHVLNLAAISASPNKIPAKANLALEALKIGHAQFRTAPSSQTRKWPTSASPRTRSSPSCATA